LNDEQVGDAEEGDSGLIQSTGSYLETGLKKLRRPTETPQSGQL